MSVSQEVIGVLVPRYKLGMSADSQEESLAGELKVRRMFGGWESGKEKSELLGEENEKSVEHRMGVKY